MAMNLRGVSDTTSERSSSGTERKVIGMETDSESKDLGYFRIDEE